MRSRQGSSSVPGAGPVLSHGDPPLTGVRQSQRSRRSGVLYERDDVGGEVRRAVRRVVAAVPAWDAAGEDAEVSDEMRLVVIAGLAATSPSDTRGSFMSCRSACWNRSTRATVFGGNPSSRANSRSCLADRGRGRRRGHRSGAALADTNTRGRAQNAGCGPRRPSRSRKNSSSSAARPQDPLARSSASSSVAPAPKSTPAQRSARSNRRGALG